MKEKITFGGRSLVFNIAFVIINLVGLGFIVAGSHENFESNATMFLSIGWIMMMLSIGGLIIFKGKLMISTVSRVLVGGLFIVSGLVKANDPIGFSYKLEEYFEDGALAYRVKELFGAPGFSLEFLVEWALVISVIICIAEIVLGVLVIIGGKIKVVSYLMLLMMIFFTMLTWHTSTCDPDVRFLDHDTYQMSDPVNARDVKSKLEIAKEQELKEKEAKKAKKKFKKTVWVVSKSSEEVVIAEMKTPQCVTDCGCFGDALKGSVGRSLTPYESFWKDIILLYLVIWIFFAQWITKPNTRKQNMIMIPASLIVVSFFSWVFGWYFPILFASVALIGSLWILRAGRKILGNHYGSALLVAILSSTLVWFVLRYDPIKDYRPYAVGSNLIEKMSDGEKTIEKRVYIYTKNGREKILDEQEYFASEIWEDSTWEYVGIDKEVVKRGRPASIVDFNPFIAVDELSDAERNSVLVTSVLESIETSKVLYRSLEDSVEGEIALRDFNLADFPSESYEVLDTVTAESELTSIDIKNGILAQKKIVMVVSQNLSDGSWEDVENLEAIRKACEAKGVPFIVVCNTTRKEIDAFREKHNFNAPFFSLDGIELKVISRSNPAVLVIENAVVKAKYPHRSIPEVKSFKQKHLK